MNAIGILAGALFLIWAAAFAYVAVKGRAGTLKKGSLLGLHSPTIDADADTWTTAHTGAWPLMAAGAIVSTFHGIGCMVAATLMGDDGTRFAQALVFMGLVVCVGLWWLAGKAGDDAVRRSPRR